MIVIYVIIKHIKKGVKYEKVFTTISFTNFNLCKCW